MQNIVREVNRIGKCIWVVGGAVRDQLLNQPPKDIDFATNYDHLALEALLSRMGLVVIPDMTAKQHGIIRTVDRDTGEVIDIARLRRDQETDGRHAIVEFTDILEEDLARRDFTINAMAAQIDNVGKCINLVDLFGGEQDLKTRTVRFVNSPEGRVQEDYLRMIRACRFTALGDAWTIEKKSEEAIKAHAVFINKISVERIRDEFLKALGYQRPSKFIRNLHTCGLLQYVAPDISNAVGVDQNEYHAESVFEHMVRSLDASVKLTDNVLLRLAALLHDVGKPPTKSIDEDNRIHFYNHEVVGTYVVNDWMRKMKFSNEQVEYVCKLVRHHQWRFNDDTKDKTIKRWLNAVGVEDWRDLITLRCADRQGNLAKKHKPMVTQKMRELMQKAQGILDRKEPLSRKDLAINGHDLIDLGFKPGYRFKQILDELVELVVDDPSFNEKEKLLQHVTTNYVN